jgi:polysaccharide deacetylase 2 family uncharacterized protein YibQ
VRPDRTTPLRSWLIGCLGFATATVGAWATPVQPDPAEPRVVCTDPSTTGPVEEHDQLVIIIDDLGHNRTRGRDAIDLPGNITYAVIPFTHYGRELAEHAHSAGKEVMLHTPMSTVDGDHIGTGGLTADLSRTEFNTRLNNALADIPHVQGINNHMGSDLTQRRMQMGWLMQELRWQELYFVDSRTSGRTIAARIATEFSVPNLSREVFLDNRLDADYLAARFAEAVRHARRTGSAVLIGHPHRETIRYLREVIPTLAEQGIELVTVSQALSLSDKEEEDSLVAGLVSYTTGCQS